MKFQPTSSNASAAGSHAFALASADRRLVAANDAFAKLLGYDTGELCGRTLDAVTHWPDAAIDSDLLDQLFAGEIPSYEIAKRYEHKEGHMVKLQLLVSTVADAKGKIAFAVVQVRPLSPGAAATLGQFSGSSEANDEVEKIKRAMFW